MSKEQGSGNDGKAGTGGNNGGGGNAGGNAGGGGATVVATLTNALRFERDKNQVLLNEVVALEDELVNRQMADFATVISDATRDFWREQLLSNREAALAALGELAQIKDEGGRLKDEGDGGGGGRNGRPLHNRQTVRPAMRRGFVGEGAPAEPGADSLAVKIRNRAHELSKIERIPFSAAFRRAEKEISGGKS